MMFDHEDIHTLAMEDIPLNRDIFIMGEEWLAPYEASLLGLVNGKEYVNVGYISYACARSIGPNSVELSWYPNIMDRHHEVRVTLPRSEFVICVECWQCDEKPHVFVSDKWLRDLHMRPYSVFALVDAIGVREALADGSFSVEKLERLRGSFDEIAARYPDTLIVSFADSLLLKMNWSVGQYDEDVEYTYQPESIFPVVAELFEVYRAILELKCYAILSQGHNQFYDNELVHTSKLGHHISLNSLGLPMAQIFAIEMAAKSAAKAGRHPYAEIYMDENLFRSLKLDYSFDKRTVDKHPYRPPLAGYPCEYILADSAFLKANLKPDRDDDFLARLRESRRLREANAESGKDP
jgi:hypothetical protein